MPIKFSLWIDAKVDAVKPFVYNEDLEIRVYDAKSLATILHKSVFGRGPKNYRIYGKCISLIFRLKRPRQPTL